MDKEKNQKSEEAWQKELTPEPFGPELRAEGPGRREDRIVTEITPASTFWRAEEYHQRYLEKRGDGVCY